MKAKLRGRIKTITKSSLVAGLNAQPNDTINAPDGAWVFVVLEDMTGSVTEGQNGIVVSRDAKFTGADVKVWVKALVGSELKFGQEIFITVSTEEES